MAMVKPVLSQLILIAYLASLAGCSEDTPTALVAEQDVAHEEQQTNPPPQNSVYCQDLIATLGPKEALSLCTEQAESGNLQASSALGDIYASGVLGGVDWPKANHWYLQAARLGDPKSQYHIGSSLELGRGIAKDASQAQVWFNQAALLDFAPAQVKVGLAQNDPQSAYGWFEKSAAAGNPQGLYQLGLQYLEGKAVAKDVFQAEKCLSMAAEKGETMAMIQLGDLYRLGMLRGQADPDKAIYWYTQALQAKSMHAQFHVANLMFNQQLRLGADPIQLLQQAAGQGHPEAQLALAKRYLAGENLPKDDNLAFQWLLEAAEQEQPQALYEVGLVFIQGTLGQPKDLDKGMYYLKQAQKKHYQPADVAVKHLTSEGVAQPVENFQEIEALHRQAQLGSLEAQVKLAKQLATYGIPKYDKAAYHWAIKAATTEQPQALLVLAEFNANGIGTPVNFEKAFALYSKLAEDNYPQAQFAIGKMLYEGRGVKRDPKAAKNWVLAAAKANVPESKALALKIYQNEPEDDEIDINHEWLDFAAENGSSKALYTKGMNYLFGQFDTDDNIHAGLQLLTQAAQMQYPAAQRELGKIYMQGMFGEENQTKAHGYFLQAAKLGDEYSQFRLAHMYYYGIGVPRNYVQAYAWANITAQKGHQDGVVMRNELSSILSKDEISSAKLLLAKLRIPGN